MRALCWRGTNDLAVETVPDPTLLSPSDVVLRVILSATCGSDLHLLGGYIPTMRPGDIIGHEFLGEVVAIGADVGTLTRGDRVVVCSIIACGVCEYCQREEFSLCDNSNPNAWIPESVWGHTIAGVFGYSHMTGGYAGSHAEYVRVPMADHGCFRVPDEVSDEEALFCSDAFPTGYMGADLAGIEPGDVVAVWGAGGVGLMAMHSAYLLGAGQVIAIDRLPERLELAAGRANATPLNYERVDVHEALLELTGGRGPDRCIDCVGMEAHTPNLIGDAYDRGRQQLKLHQERGTVLRQMIRACRKGGTVSILGVYGGFVDKFPIGAAMNKGLTLRMGQQHGQRYIPRLLHHVARGDVDPSYLVTHPLPLEQAPRGYELFKEKRDGCVRAVFRP